MTQDIMTHPNPATDPRRPEEPQSPALSIYEHFMGLQRLRGWLREN